MRINRLVGGLLLALICGVAIAACGGSSHTTNTSSHTGATATANKSPYTVFLVSAKIPGLDLLDPYDAGAAAAVKTINADGGFGGHPIVLQTCNSMLQPANAIDCAHKIVEAHAIAMWGCEPAWSSSGALSILQHAGIPSFNCPNTTQDATNPEAFSIFPGGTAEYGSGAKYICTLSDVHTVYWIAQQNPEQQADIPPALTKIFNGCGKTIKFLWFPFTAVDVTPYVAKIVQSHPDFVMQNVTGAAGVDLLKAFNQQGFPTSKIWSSSDALDTANFLKPAGKAANGLLVTSELLTWDQTSDPTVAAYDKATATGVTDPDAFEPLWGWIQMYWFKTVAQHVGYDNFSSAALSHFMSTAPSVRIPGSRTMLNPGPPGAPQIKQPYSQVLRYDNGHFTVQEKGTDSGWINGLA